LIYKEILSLAFGNLLVAPSLHYSGEKIRQITADSSTDTLAATTRKTQMIVRTHLEITTVLLAIYSYFRLLLSLVLISRIFV